MVSPNSVAMVVEDAFKRVRGMEAPLAERLDAFAAFGRQINQQFEDVWDDLIERLRSASTGAAAPAPGDPMPPFVLPDQDGRLVVLTDILRKGPAAIVFNRGHWCPYCRLNTIALTEAQGRVAAEGGQVVAITPDLQRYARVLQADAGAHFPILTDIDNGYALSLGIAIALDAELQAQMARRGRDLPRYHGNGAWTLPIPATFVVGRDGVVTARFIDPDFRKRWAIEDLVEALGRAQDA